MHAFFRLSAGLCAGFVVTLALAVPAAAQPWSVTFIIDMKARIAAKTFDPAKDTVGVRSGFAPLAWERTLPAQDPDGDGLYEVTVTFPKRPFGGQPVAYKFKVERAGAPANDGWEEGTNRWVALDAPRKTVRRVFDEPAVPLPPVRTGTFRTHPAFVSHFLPPRDVVVYLPPGYEKDVERRYPVLYLHDGQNIFDAAKAGMEWQADETAERLIRAGAIEPLIIVGIANTDARKDEYTPTYVEFKREDGVVLKGGGRADLYGRLIVEDLKPFIDRTYRTRPDAASTGIGGASFGGLVSLYLGLRYPDVFGIVFGVSPSVWWDDGMILKMIRALPQKTAQRIWTDIGTGEGDEDVAGIRSLRDALTVKGWTLGSGFAYMEDEGAEHDELSWAARFEPMLRWGFPAAK
jgi:predicted alpha/beta superfamily hydrolase